MTGSQVRALGNKKRLSKEDIERIAKGLDPIESEDDAQARVVEYLEELKHSGKVLKFTAIPNNTWTPSDAAKKKNTRLGLRPGLCDLLIAYLSRVYMPNKGYLLQEKLLWIEMKREKGGTASPEQKEWIEILDRVKGSSAYVANGFEDAKSIIDTYIF